MKSGFEVQIRKQLKSNKVSHWYEPVKLPYFVEATYSPDFVLGCVKKPLTIEDLKGKIIIETKGRFKVEDRRKMLAVKTLYPDLDIRLVFQQDAYVYKNKTKTRRTKECTDMKYSDWATKYGFKYAIGTIPKEWLH